MTILQRIAREPNAVVGLIVGIYGVLVAFDILSLTAPQVGALTALGGAAVFALRWLVTPANEVVAQKQPGQIFPTAGPALKGADNGDAVHVSRILGKA